MRSLRGNARFLHLFRLPIMLLEPAAHLSLDSMLPLSSTSMWDFPDLPGMPKAVRCKGFAGGRALAACSPRFPR